MPPMDLFTRILNSLSQKPKPRASEEMAPVPPREELDRMEKEISEGFEWVKTTDEDTRYMAALAAPYRLPSLGICHGSIPGLFSGESHFFSDWGGPGNRVLRFPSSLYTFGDSSLIPPRINGSLMAVLKQDYGVDNRDQVFEAAGDLVYDMTECYDDYLTEECWEEKEKWDEEGRLWPWEPVGGNAISRLCHLLATAADVGLITVDEALGVLPDLDEYLSFAFSNWEAYGNAVVKGDAELKVNGPEGLEDLKECVNLLMKTPRGPWSPDITPWRTRHVDFPGAKRTKTK